MYYAKLINTKTECSDNLSIYHCSGDHSRVEGFVEGVSVHHHTTKQSVILSATLVQLEEEDDQRNHQTHCTLEERASHTPVYVCACGWVEGL